jgi:hypothetical protein
MPFSDVLQGASIFALLTIFIGFVPLAAALSYVIRPSERKLAFMRPFSLSAIFGGLCGVLAGFIAVLRGIGVAPQFTTQTFNSIAVGFAEALVPVFVGFGCLTIAWLLVALGMRRAA